MKPLLVSSIGIWKPIVRSTEVALFFQHTAHRCCVQKRLDRSPSCIAVKRIDGLFKVGEESPMMGEYLLYFRGKLIGGIYDDRLLVKPTPRAKALLPDAEYQTPYGGAKEMLLVDVDDRELLLRLFETMYDELPKSLNAVIRREITAK